MMGGNPAQGSFGSMTPSGMTVGQGIGYTPNIPAPYLMPNIQPRL